MSDFVVKDSGKRIDYPSGMRRDVNDGKPRYTLIERNFLYRIAMHLTKGAVKYGDNNWQLANSEEEFKRFQESAFRHMIQWLNDERDEDHMAAVCFNLMAAEFVRAKLPAKKDEEFYVVHKEI